MINEWVAATTARANVIRQIDNRSAVATRTGGHRVTRIYDIQEPTKSTTDEDVRKHNPKVQQIGLPGMSDTIKITILR